MIPNIISFIRILISPLLFQYPLIILTIGGMTDFFDGLIARYLRQESAFGAMLDIVADKIFLVCWYISSFCYLKLSLTWFLIMIGRDLLLAIGSFFIHQVTVSSIFIGKLYIASHMILAPIMLLGIISQDIYQLITCGLAIMSLCVYIRRIC